MKRLVLLYRYYIHSRLLKIYITVKTGKRLGTVIFLKIKFSSGQCHKSIEQILCRNAHTYKYHKGIQFLVKIDHFYCKYA